MKFGTPPVTFVFHLGVHCTDEDMLVRSLLSDGHALLEQGIAVPRPRKYRKSVREHMHQYHGDPMPEEAQMALYEMLLEGHPAERVILSDQDYLTLPPGVFEHRQLYSKAGFRSTWLRYLFPENPCEFFIAIRNPATYLPAALKQRHMPDYEKFVNGCAPQNMLWSGVIERIQQNNLDCPITVWCNEDTPLIWPRLLRMITAVKGGFEFAGSNDVLRSIMKPEGFEKMAQFLEVHPPQSEIQRHRVIAAFVDKFALDEALEEEIDLPGWTPDLVDEITGIYEDDVDRIAQMPGVRLITP